MILFYAQIIALTAYLEKNSQSSSLMITDVVILEPRSASCGSDSVAVNLSLSSLTLSLIMVTVTTWLTVPGTKVSVRNTEV